MPPFTVNLSGKVRLKCDSTRAETRLRLSPKRTSPFKSVWASVQSTAGSRGVHISGSKAGYTISGVVCRVLVTHSIRQFPPSLPLPCVIVCHQVSNAVYDAHQGSLTLTYPFNRGVGALQSWSGLFGEEKVSCPLLEIKPRLLHRPSCTLGTTEGMTSPQTYSVHVLITIQQPSNFMFMGPCIFIYEDQKII